jgi:hypothetical protein
MSIFGTVLGVAAYRNGNIVVVPAGCTLPAVCVKCGESASVRFLTKTFRWHSSWLYLLILPGLIFYAIAVLIVQKKARIEVPFCEVHRTWRKRMYIAGSVLLVGFIPVSLLLASLELSAGWVALTAIAMAFAGLVVLAIVGNSLTPVYIDGTRAELKGAGEQFLSSLPSGPVSSPQGVAS